MGTPITRDSILSAPSFRQSKLIEVGGLTLRIVGLSSAELARGRETAAEEDPVENGRRRMLEFVRWGVVDDDRRRIFESMEEVEAFEDKFEQPAFLAIASAIADMTHGEGAGDEGKAPSNASSATPTSSTPTT